MDENCVLLVKYELREGYESRDDDQYFPVITEMKLFQTESDAEMHALAEADCEQKRNEYKSYVDRLIEQNTIKDSVKKMFEKRRRPPHITVPNINYLSYEKWIIKTSGMAIIRSVDGVFKGLTYSEIDIL